MIINKDRFKEYLNGKCGYRMRVNGIESVSLHKMTFYENQISKDSKYIEEVKKNGFVELVMIKPIWSGWKIVEDRTVPEIKSELVGTWAYRDNRSNSRFGLDDYKQWLVSERDKKLELIGI